MRWPRSAAWASASVRRVLLARPAVALRHAQVVGRRVLVADDWQPVGPDRDGGVVAHLTGGVGTDGHQGRANGLAQHGAIRLNAAQVLACGARAEARPGGVVQPGASCAAVMVLAANAPASAAAAS